MKRDRDSKNGRFRRSETSSYKMTKHDGFEAVSWQAFQEAALDKYDFRTCQRPDGSFYGTGGQCRKGTETTKPEGEKKTKSKSGGGGGKMSSAEKETKAMVEIAGGDAEGMIVKGSERIKPDALMRNVGRQLKKEYGIELDHGLANGAKIADGYIDGFVSTKNGNVMSVSMERDGDEWIVESMDVI